MEVFLGLAGTVLMLAVIWRLFAPAGDMTEDRGPSPWPWTVLSLASSPIASTRLLRIFWPRDDDA